MLKLLDSIQALVIPIEEGESFTNKERLGFWGVLVFFLIVLAIAPNY